MMLNIGWGDEMASNSTLKILDGLRKNCKEDTNLRLFLEAILSEEIKGAYFWRDYYKNYLEEYVKDWDDNED